MLKPGMFISDRYEIIDKVGSGGMADVYKARCHRLNRFVAIKVLKSEFSDDKNFVKKFRGEAQSAAGLSHPNIVNVYDVGDDEGLHYIVMELVEGITLKSFIERKGRLETKEAVGIGIQIAMGMEAAHTNHIVHRDIKPQNIIISKEGKVKVTDFGIAKATNSNTITSNAMGSVHYLSPEQARGGYSDEKSDIYSLGVTLYEMLSGQVPFAGDNTVSVALLHIQGEATPLRELEPTIPISVEKIVNKCMQKKPERRYLSASELIADLKRSISNPNGDFVVISQPMVSDSPTITFSEDEVSHINQAAMMGNKYDKGRDALNTDARRRSLNETEDITEDEEDFDKVDPRVEKFVIIGSIAAGVILVILIIFFVVNILNLFPGSGKDTQTTPEVTMEPSPTPTTEVVETISVPTVVGLLSEDAQTTLYAKSKDLKIEFDEASSDEYKVGMVMEQYPSAGTEIESTGNVKLIISTGPESFKIPNVYNLTDSQAVTMLEEAELKVLHDYAFSDEIEEGRVISTDPARETFVVSGDTVTVLVSNGPEQSNAIVPELKGFTEEVATGKLQENGLKVGDVTSGYSNTYGVGTVMGQSQAAGAEVPKDSTIDIQISLGPEPTQAPTEYEGHVTINENPFEYPGDSGIVMIDLKQDGNITTQSKEIMSYDDFPLAMELSSKSGSNGTIIMYIGREVEEYEDGVVSENGVFIKYEQYETTWNVTFTPVGD
ncbi:MAG: Stk1 family PASTA domain-containing Ser/Thr kinase [Anaerocolumna sp.]